MSFITYTLLLKQFFKVLNITKIKMIVLPESLIVGEILEARYSCQGKISRLVTMVLYTMVYEYDKYLT